MKKSEIVSKIHSSLIVYMLIGWLIESQRKYLVLLLPTVQFQFLVNNDECVITQLENKFLKEENKEDEVKESFVDSQLKYFNIHLEPHIRKNMIYGCVYGSFLMSYFLM